MAERVVDVLEVVYVDCEERDLAAEARRRAHRLIEHLLQAAAVETARERIGQHHRRELGAQLIVRAAQQRDAVGLYATLLDERARQVTALRAREQIDQRGEAAVRTC